MTEKRKYSKALLGLFTILAASSIAGGSRVNAETGGLVWMLFGATTGTQTHCESGNRCVTYDVNSLPWGGNNNAQSATAPFQTQTIVGCTVATSGRQFRNGTAANPDAGDFVFYCPFGDPGYSTWYLIDPT